MAQVSSTPEHHFPTALYIHIPWCVKKCPYCDFNSHAIKDDCKDELPEIQYVDSLLQDLELECRLFSARTISSIFIGGGTPSLLSGKSISRLLSGVHERLEVNNDAEITLEANPGTLEAGRFEQYRKAGVNRLSIGVQSLDDASLEAIGRIHTAEQASRAIKTAREAGFNNINLDMMFGLPGQSLDHALIDLQKLLEFAPEHLSWYQLTIEPNTLFHRYPPELPDDDHLFEIQEAGHTLLNNSGYGQYEVSAWARPSHQCRHNLNYWQFGDYYGIGAGAHGKITTQKNTADFHQAVRRVRRRRPFDYMAAAGTEKGISQTSRPAGDELLFEFMLNALRLKHGFVQDLFSQRTGLDWQAASKPVEQAVSENLLQVSGQRVQPTEHGYRFLNNLVGLFLPRPPA